MGKEKAERERAVYTEYTEMEGCGRADERHK